MAGAMKILQCDSRGDTRFSPFFCWVEAFGVRDSIEEHYQKSKTFVDADGRLYHPTCWRQAKAYEKTPDFKRHDHFRLPNGRMCPAKYLVFGWYAALWVKYLDEHPDLVEYARGFDDYSDRFKGLFPLCQADCVRLYVKKGRAALVSQCRDFLAWVVDNRC